MKISINKGPYKGYTADVIDIIKKQHKLSGEKKYTTSVYKASLNSFLDGNKKIIEVTEDQIETPEQIETFQKRKRTSSSSTNNKKKRVSSSIGSPRSFKSTSAKSNTSDNSGSNDEKEYKNNFQYFNFLQKQNIKDQVYLDTNDFITLLQIEADFDLVKKYSEDIKEIIKRYFKTKEVNTRLFIIAYFFVHFNSISSNIPYKPQYRDIVSPNDNFLYILNASIYNKFINKHVDIPKYQEYISIVLDAKNTFIKKSIQYSQKILQDRQKSKKMYTPVLEKQRFFKKNISNIQALEIKQNIIKNIIDNIKKRSYAKNVDKYELLKKLNELFYNNIDKDFVINDQNELLYGDIKTKTSNDLNNTPTEKMFNEIKKKIQGDILFKMNELKYKDDNDVNEIVKNQIKDIIKIRLNDTSLSDKERTLLKDYTYNIGNNSYISNLPQKEKEFLENYNKAFNALSKFNINNRINTLN